MRLEMNEIISSRIKISHPGISDEYYIDQDESHGMRFFVTSKNGYNGYEGNGYGDLISALKQVKKLIATDLIDKE